MLIDTHCHLTDDRFAEDLSAVLNRARETGVEKVVSVASNRADAVRVQELLDRAPGVEGWPALWGTAGVHPHEAEEARDGDLEAIAALASHHPRVVAMGETGLDFFYDNSPRDVQEDLFRAHMEMGWKLDLPVVVHSRSADEATGRVLRDWAGKARGVLHCFTGGEELLTTALELGWMISLTGIITFKKYEGVELVRSLPRDRLMVETDGPYLAPVPHRGKRNEPSFVPRVAEALARIRGEDPEEVAGYTTENAVRFFGLTD